MLAIKLQRIGKKHQPSYRFVVAERRSKMAAPPVEDLGSYNPATKTVTVGKDRVAYWIKSGAQPTITVHNLFIKEGIIAGAKLAVKIKAKAKAEAEGAGAKEAPKAEAKTAPAAAEAAA